ncbi:hypothetical protein CHUAL_007763 [Chamberlinius hualienensis]
MKALIVAIVSIVIVVIIIGQPIPQNFIEGPFYIEIDGVEDAVLDIDELVQCSGSNLIINQKQPGKKHQLWEWYNNGLIRNVYNGYFLTQIQPDSSYLTLWPPHGNYSQRWFYEDVNRHLRDWNLGCIAKPISKSIKSGEKVRYSEKCENGLKVKLRAQLYISTSRMKIESYCLYLLLFAWINSCENMIYVIQNMDSELVLDVEDGKICANAKVIVDELNTYKLGQRWEFYNETMLRNVLTGLVLDIKGKGSPPGKNAILYPPHGKGSQRWDHHYDKVIQNWNKICLDATENTPKSSVMSAKCSDSNSQKWELIDFETLKDEYQC